LRAGNDNASIRGKLLGSNEASGIVAQAMQRSKASHKKAQKAQKIIVLSESSYGLAIG
jgi:hypothetical protein